MQRKKGNPTVTPRRKRAGGLRRTGQPETVAPDACRGSPIPEKDASAPEGEPHWVVDFAPLPAGLVLRRTAASRGSAQTIAGALPDVIEPAWAVAIVDRVTGRLHIAGVLDRRPNADDFPFLLAGLVTTYRTRAP